MSTDSTRRRAFVDNDDVLSVAMRASIHDDQGRKRAFRRFAIRRAVPSG